jgi:hypothetical protein
MEKVIPIVFANCLGEVFSQWFGKGCDPLGFPMTTPGKWLASRRERDKAL